MFALPAPFREREIFSKEVYTRRHGWKRKSAKKLGS
jgi:hypothetical protein